MSIPEQISPNRRRDDQPPGWRIGIVGAGGQGVITAARLLCEVFVDRGHDVASSQLHGMAQRGGMVQSTVVIDGGISPVLGRASADVIVGFEPAETVRVLDLMSSRTVVLMNTVRVVPFVVSLQAARGEEGIEYPNVDELVNCVLAVTPFVHSFAATDMAAQAGSPRTLNTLMLGCLLGSGILPCDAETFWTTVTRIMPPPLADINRRAFFCGAAVGGRLRLDLAETVA